MEPPEAGPAIHAALTEILGYLNFSSGAPDPRFQSHVNQVYGWLLERSPESGAPWQALPRLLRDELERLQAGSAAFADSRQAGRMLQLVFDRLLPAYRKFHRDLLFHQHDAALFTPFFIARAIEATLQHGEPWEPQEEVVDAVLRQLNDFVGHRPVAVLHNQRMEPYPHERVRPVPLYLRGAGVGVGRYQPLLHEALQILTETDDDLLNAAHCDPARMEELAVDPRAYDFDHPANKRINYQFGQWDPHHLDQDGYYSRFVLTGVTLQTLHDGAEQLKDIPRQEALFETAAVLAGIVLMASAVSGHRPGAHDSTVTLASLLPRIAVIRDTFYERLLARAAGDHGERLRAEALEQRQPFGRVRQHLNQRLAKLRALQQQHVFLARVFAQMGFPEASRRQVTVVPVASARMQCEIDCRLTAAHLDIDRADLPRAAQQLREVKDLLHRAIDCGAIVDPWNILGFGGQFSLFPSPENSVADHRVDELIDTVEEIFALHARLLSESAAVGNDGLRQSVEASAEQLATWWDRFASVEVSDVAGFSGRETVDSASQVAAALQAWHQAGAAAGDIAFWRGRVNAFHSSKSYALVVAALLEKNDHAASMALLMQWLSQADEVHLEDSEHSFYRMTLRWLNEVRQFPAYDAARRWELVNKFFDFLGANAGEYGQVPEFAWADGNGPDEEQEDEEDEENPYAAAYEGVVYRDTTADGIEGELLDGGGGQVTDFQLDLETETLGRRLAYLAALAELWRAAATMVADADAQDGGGAPLPEGVAPALTAWYAQAADNCRQLNRLLDEVHRFQIPPAAGNPEAMVEFDRRQMVKELLQDRILRTSVITGVAARALLAVAGGEPPEDVSGWQRRAFEISRDVALRNPEAVRARLPELTAALRDEPLLYVPTARGGRPELVGRARDVQEFLGELLRAFPRLGLLRESCELMQLALQMEAHHPGSGATSEFHHLFTIGFQAQVECLVLAAQHWTGGEAQRETRFDGPLIDCLNLLTEKVLKVWLVHSRSLRLSAVEALLDEDEWDDTVDFVKRYGDELFVPRFLNEGNLRAILHMGAEAYLERLAEEDADLRLVEDIHAGKAPASSGVVLERVIQAILENYTEFNDYNHTTTQSDQGSMLYCLLDFLRLKVSYERVSWNLKPVVLAHEILVRHRRDESAHLWRSGVADKTAEAAEHHLERYEELKEKYAMRLPTLHDLLEERFVQPLEVDRIVSLIKPAMEELRRGDPPRTFERLEQEINEFGQSPIGVGIDLPQWLAALEDEVQRIRQQRQPELSHRHQDGDLWVPLAPREVQRQLEDWDPEVGEGGQ